MYISHLNSVKNHLYYYDTVLVNMEFSFAPKRTKVRERVKNFLGIAPNSTSILIKGLMCVAVGFSFAPTRTYGARACEKFSQIRAKTLTLNFN